MPTGQLALSFASLVLFQQAVHTVNRFMIPATNLPSQRLEQLAKAVTRVDFQHRLDGRNDRQVTVRIRLL